MADYPNIRHLASFATEDYSRIESIEQIRPPYPAQGSPNWWALRLRYEELLMAKIRRGRMEKSAAKPVNEAEANAAKWAALGNEQADRDYQAFVPPATEIYKRRRPDWLAMATDVVRQIPE